MDRERLKSHRHGILRLRRFDEKRKEERSILFMVTTAVLVASFGLVIFRLISLQVIHYEEFKKKSENNRSRIITIPSPRGNILDRSGRAIATIRPSFNLLFYREAGGKRSMARKNDVLARVSELTGAALPLLQTRVLEASKKHLPMYMPVVLERDMGWEAFSRVEANLHRLPGVAVSVVPRRRYPYGVIAPHLIGYIDEISLEEIRAKRFPYARPGDLVGKSGVEFVHDRELRGISGTRKVEIDAKGRLVRVLDYNPPEPGKDIYLTIDTHIQQAAKEAIRGEVGAVVALEPKTGAVLGLVSAPGFDPEVFVGRLSRKLWEELNDPLTRPLMNKAIQGQYPPGSVFKLLMALAALKEGVITPETTFSCNSYFRLGRRVFRCWDWRGHGETDLYKAIVQSCDVYFYNVGLRLGIDKISQYAGLFGLGHKTGIDLPGEESGRVPNRQWKLGTLKEPWQKGETLNTSIGQGFLTTTPIQLASLVSTIVNGGKVMRPQYVLEIRDPGGGVVKGFSPVVKKELDIPTRFFTLVEKAMVGVVEDKKGTGKAARIKGLTLGGKTGTAQVVRQKRRRESEKLPWRYRDHAWFVAFAPADDPGIVVAVLVEHGGHGGSKAGPIAKKVIEAWLATQRAIPAVLPGRAI